MDTNSWSLLAKIMIGKKTKQLSALNMHCNFPKENIQR